MAESGLRGGHVRVGAALAAAALALACAAARARGGPEARVRLEAPPAVGWEPEGPFVLPLGLHNASGVTLALARPSPAALLVQVLRAADGSVACGTPSPTRRQSDARDVVQVPGGSEVALQVDLWPYCRGLAPGVYRYEATFVANPAEAGAGLAYVGTLGPQGGRLAVGVGLSRHRAALAALAGAHGEAPPAPAQAPAGPAAVADDAAGPRARAARACVDRELARRGLNAYGDPEGTRYPSGPPADEGGRALYVAGRSPSIRVACGLDGY